MPHVGCSMRSIQVQIQGFDEAYPTRISKTSGVTLCGSRNFYNLIKNVLNYRLWVKISMQYSAKNLQNNRLDHDPWQLASPSAKSLDSRLLAGQPRHHYWCTLLGPSPHSLTPAIGPPAPPPPDHVTGLLLFLRDFPEKNSVKVSIANV